MLFTIVGMVFISLIGLFCVLVSLAGIWCEVNLSSRKDKGELVFSLILLAAGCSCLWYVFSHLNLSLA